ncbi:HAMP domain-containing protein [Caloranaerobacter azorensis DSM 13643]|uniref:histidine kinase n=1 Tax=Caloranaerobacter azorensis DSM 13643 TaxID=1121264 RepID=A0A1M5THL8_9FIRM|nr:HAMP domain-containing protein [Caloranaerobacter azorensis DSM 13643]
MVLISQIIIGIFISQNILNTYIQEKRQEILTKSNILSNRIKFYLTNNEILVLDSLLKTLVENYSKEIKARIIIVDKNNIVKSDSNNEFEGSKLYHLEIQKALAGISNSNVYNFKEYGHVMYVAVPIILDDEVVGATFTSVSLNDIYNVVDRINNKIRLISLVSTVLIALMSFIFADFITKPISEMTKAITKMAQGNLGLKVEIKTNDEFKQLANAFNVMSTKLSQVDKQRKDFVANVSHELRTPLSSIKLLSESLLHQEKVDALVYKEFLQDIDSEIDRLNNIIDDLLILVDLDKEKLTLDFKTTYINFLLEKIIARLKPLAENKKISLDYIEREKIQIKVDANKIQQAVINIIHNAIKYTPEGGRVEVKLYTERDYVVIRVKDNGIGIPKESLPQIFDRFYRVDKARSRSTGGTGLGLSIAYQIVSLHQGTIDVESELGKGSTFYIKIPIDLNLA